MGLEAVEIVMSVEETFDIVIEDAEAEKLTTPRDIIACVLLKVGRTDHAQCLTQRAFHRIRTSLIRRAGIKRSDIKPETQTGRLFPVRQRIELLRKTLDDIGVRASPEMVRPRWFVGVLFGLSISAGAAAAIICAARVSSSASIIVQLLTVSPPITAGIVAVLFGWIAARLTRDLRREFTPALATVGGFSRWIVAQEPEAIGAPPGQWSREQVRLKVKEIVINNLGCESSYREDAQFVKDLGMG